jgi:hypothetical protein
MSRNSYAAALVAFILGGPALGLAADEVTPDRLLNAGSDAGNHAPSGLLCATVLAAEADQQGQRQEFARRLDCSLGVLRAAASGRMAASKVHRWQRTATCT